jgi:hypothetical protein
MSADPTDSQTWQLKGDPSRQAPDTIRGYIYQSWRALKAWLELEPGQTLYLEGAEDFDVTGGHKGTTVQVKATAKPISLRSPCVLEAIQHFWELTQAHPDKDIRFIYLTCSGIAKEQGETFRDGEPGLKRWQNCDPTSVKDMTAISSFLAKQKDAKANYKLSSDLRIFLDKASSNELFERFIKRISWITKAPPHQKIAEEVDQLLIEFALQHRLGVSAPEAKKVSSHLFREIMEVSSKKSDRELSKARFAEIFDEKTRISVPVAALSGGVIDALPNLITQEERIADCNEVVLRADYTVGLSLELPRTEVELILSKLGSDGERHGALVTGEAGVGKSGVLYQLARKLASDDTPFLYFRLDRRQAVERPEELGKQLFGFNRSPVDVLTAIAGNRSCVLIIDQLDALSEVSGRDSWFFDCVNQLVQTANQNPRIGIVLACRKFDLEHDHRLRKLVGPHGIAEEVPVKRLTDDQVKSAIAALKFDAARLSPTQITLLQLPLHLSLFAETHAEAPDDDPYRFHSAKDLFDRYWSKKERQVRERLSPASSQWLEVIDLVTQQISESQELSLPKVRLDSVLQTANVMESEHILVGDRSRIGFFHESFFDYAFARRFVANGKDLLSYLKNVGQHLFRRAQVRQVLLHQRDADRKAYLHLLQNLLVDKEIRYHIKRVVAHLVGNLPDPNGEEWDVIADVLTMDDEALTRDIRMTLWNNPAWLSLLGDNGYLQNCLAGPDEILRNWTVRSLCRYGENFPDMVADLLESYQGRSEEWNDLLWGHLRSGSAIQINRRLFRLFLALLNGKTEIGREDFFWHTLDSLSKIQPKWAAEAIGISLSKQLAGLPDKVVTRQFLGRGYAVDQVFIKTANEASVVFIEQVLPFFMEVLKRYAKAEQCNGNDLLYFLPWSYRRLRDDSMDNVVDAVLFGLEDACQNLATNDLEQFRVFVEEVKETNFEPGNFLLIRAYTVGAQHFADDAVNYLCEKPARMRCGWENLGGEYWGTRELISAIVPHCDKKKMYELRRVILDYVDPFESRHNRGYAQFVMLSVLPATSHDNESRSRLQELQRKFKSTSPQPPEPMGKAQFVDSPIPAERAAKMTDENWLSAIAKYQDDRHRSAQDWFKGGAMELARQLGEATKENPKRFCALALHMPTNTNPTYFNHILMAVRENDTSAQDVFGDNCAPSSTRGEISQASENDIFAFVRYCHELPKRPCGRWICAPIAKLAKQEIPEDILDIVAWYATEDPNPTEELWRESPEDKTVYYGGDMVTTAINSVRGTAAGAIAELTWNSPDRFARFLPQIKALIQDRIVAVRSEAVRILLGQLNHESDQAVTMFLTLCGTDEDRLLGTHHVTRFIQYASPSHYTELRPLFERMVQSQYSEVRQAGARLNALAHFQSTEAVDLVEQCLKSEDVHVRKGCAEVAAANLQHEVCAPFCHRTLPQFFNDPDKDIRDIAASFLRELEGDELSSVTDLVKLFFESPAFGENTDDLVYALERSTSHLPELTFNVCERLLNLANSDNPSHHLFHDTSTLTKLLIRIYRQTGNEELQEQCLDLMDNMLRADIWDITSELQEYDR